MLTIDRDLPPGALIGGEAARLAQAIAGTGGLWFHGAPEAFSQDAAGAVVGWRPRAGSLTALPTQPNRGNGRIAPEGRGLRLTSGVHSGLAAEAALAEVASFTLGVIFHPGAEELRTLATLNLKDSKNYLFLTQQDEVVAFRSQSGAAELTLPLPLSATGPQLVLAGFSRGRMQLRLGQALASGSEAPDSGVTGPADLFIGCRSHREGLIKTLGSGTIASVFLWPLNILDPKAPEGPAQLAALEDWLFWEA